VRKNAAHQRWNRDREDDSSAKPRAGNPAHEVVRILAASRRDKPNSIYYAQRTVDVASAVIWTRAGIDRESIVHRLAERSSSRATEIVTTGLRFV
jgi:hypothetical protein